MNRPKTARKQQAGARNGRRAALAATIVHLQLALHQVSAQLLARSLVCREWHSTHARPVSVVWVWHVTAGRPAPNRQPPFPDLAPCCPAGCSACHGGRCLRAAPRLPFTRLAAGAVRQAGDDGHEDAARPRGGRGHGGSHNGLSHRQAIRQALQGVVAAGRCVMRWKRARGRGAGGACAAIGMPAACLCRQCLAFGSGSAGGASPRTSLVSFMLHKAQKSHTAQKSITASPAWTCQTGTQTGSPRAPPAQSSQSPAPNKRKRSGRGGRRWVRHVACCGKVVLLRATWKGIARAWLAASPARQLRCAGGSGTLQPAAARNSDQTAARQASAGACTAAGKAGSVRGADPCKEEGGHNQPDGLIMKSSKRVRKGCSTWQLAALGGKRSVVGASQR